eukprot:14314583-Ditylum_brightwellii.AAC.1
MDVWKARNAYLHNCLDNSEKASINKQALIHMTLEEQLRTLQTAKECWLKAIRITVHDFLANIDLTSEHAMVNTWENVNTMDGLDLI